MDHRPLHVCWHCKGTGRVVLTLPAPTPNGAILEYITQMETCPRCLGERVTRD